MRSLSGGPTLDTVNVETHSEMQPAGRVLVVEDTSDIRELLQEILSFEGYDVTAVEDGARALEQLHAARHDVGGDLRGRGLRRLLLSGCSCCCWLLLLLVLLLGSV